MARDEHMTTIDGHRYQMTMLGATAGYRLFHRLFKMFGPSIGALIDLVGDAKGGIENTDLSSKAAVKAIQALTDNVHEADLDHLIDQLKGQTMVGLNGSEKTVPLDSVFEAHFAGDITALFRWLIWALKVQYSTFQDVFATMKPPVAADVTRVDKPSP